MLHGGEEGAKTKGEAHQQLLGSQWEGADPAQLRPPASLPSVTRPLRSQGQQDLLATKPSIGLEG